MLPLNILEDPGIDVIDDDKSPPVHDSAKANDSFLLDNSEIKTEAKVSSFSPITYVGNCFIIFSLTGLIISFASLVLLAFAVILIFTSPIFAYGATVGLSNFKYHLFFL